MDESEEKLIHFDHESIPGRAVHARCSGAHGFFQVYAPMTEYTRAKFLLDSTRRTPVFVRVSTIVGSRGSAEHLATKLYTEDGNYDLVANNAPVFFIQDAMIFPHLVHSTKPEPNSVMPQASAAHDTFRDFVVNPPEITHMIFMILWMLSDRTIWDAYSSKPYKQIETAGDSGRKREEQGRWRSICAMRSTTRRARHSELNASSTLHLSGST